jgi:hypothetical protein
VTGVSLEALVNGSHPVVPQAKNALLRVTVTVTGAGRVTLALGERRAVARYSPPSARTGWPSPGRAWSPTAT